MGQRLRVLSGDPRDELLQQFYWASSGEGKTLLGAPSRCQCGPDSEELASLVVLEKAIFPGRAVVKNLSANAGDVGSIPGSGRSPGEANGNPL